MAKRHIFESLEYFTSSIICARYEIQQFCQDNPISLTTYLISEFGYQNNIEQLICEQNKRFSIKLQKEKSRSSMSKQRLSQKTAYSSIKQQKQLTKTTSQQMLMNSYLQEKAKQFNQFLRSKNFRIYNNQEEIKDQFQEQRLFLLQSLYQRNRNLLVCLMFANQIYKDSFKFWNEIKEIIVNFMIKISEHLPQRDFQLYDLIIARYTVNHELNGVNGLSNIEKIIDNIIINNQEQKEQILFNIQKHSQMHQQSEIANQIKQFQESSSSFLIQNSQGLKLNEHSLIKKSQINQTQNTKLNQSSTVFKFIKKLNDTKKIFIDDKMQKSRQKSNSSSDNNCKNFFVNKVNEIVLSSKQQNNLDILFEFRDKLESAVQDYHLFNYYYFLENLDCMFKLFKSQILQNKGKCFIEQQPDQAFVHNNLEIFRVYYDGQQIINFLKNQRNKVNFYSISTQVQHY
ncbi:hypothetical protein ABPG72_009527 [Tetrahymena utriculariae]